MKSSETIGALAAALAAARAEMGPIVKDKIAKITSPKGNYTYAYADFSAILDKAIPALSKNGLVILQSCTTTYDDRGAIVSCVTKIVHVSNEWTESDPFSVRADSDRPQAVGSAETYSRRYSACPMLAICPEDDDDGNLAQGNQATTQPRKSGLTLGDAVGNKPAAPAGEPVYVAEKDVRALVARALAIPEPYTITKKDFADMCGPSASAVTPDSFEVMQELVAKREAKAREASEG